MQQEFGESFPFGASGPGSPCCHPVLQLPEEAAVHLVDGVQVGEEEEQGLLRQRAQPQPQPAALLLVLAHLVAEPLERKWRPA